MEQHGHELNDQNEAEEEDEHQTDRFQMQLVLYYMRLFNRNSIQQNELGQLP